MGRAIKLLYEKLNFRYRFLQYLGHWSHHGI